MNQHPPGWLIAILVLQVLIGGAFLALGVSMTVSLSGRNYISAVDILVVSVPLIASLLFGVLAWLAWRRGIRGLAVALAIVPWLLIIAALFVVLGL